LSAVFNIHSAFFVFFFVNAPATPVIYTLSLHDALPIFSAGTRFPRNTPRSAGGARRRCPRACGRCGNRRTDCRFPSGRTNRRACAGLSAPAASLGQFLGPNTVPFTHGSLNHGAPGLPTICRHEHTTSNEARQFAQTA